METPLNLLKEKLALLKSCKNNPRLKHYKKSHEQSIVEYEKAISILECALAEPSNDASALPIPDVSKSLPDGFWFDDEHGTTVTVIGIVGKWCMVEDTEHDEPYALPLEYVVSIYEESKEGNVR